MVTEWPGKVLSYNALFLRQSNNGIPHLTELPTDIIGQLEHYLARHEVTAQWCADTKDPSLDKAQAEPIKTWADFALKCLNKEYNEDPVLPKGFGFEWFNGGTGMMEDEWALYASSENMSETVRYKREDGYTNYPKPGSDMTWWQDYKEKGFEAIDDEGFADKNDPGTRVPGFPHKKETLRGKLRRFLEDDIDLADRVWQATSAPNTYRLWPARGPKVFQLLQNSNPNVVALIEYDFHNAKADYFQDATQEQDQLTFSQAMERAGYAHVERSYPHELALYWKDACFCLQSSSDDEVVNDTEEAAAREAFPKWGNAYGRVLAVKLRQKEADRDGSVIFAVTKLTPKTSDPTGTSQQQQLRYIVQTLLTSRASQRGSIPSVIMGDMNTDARVEEEIRKVFGQFDDDGRDSLGLYCDKKWSGEHGTFCFGSVFDEQMRRHLCTSPSLVRREFLDQILILQSEQQKLRVIEHTPQVIVISDDKPLSLPENFEFIKERFANEDSRATIPDKCNPSDHFPVSAVLVHL